MKSLKKINNVNSAKWARFQLYTIGANMESEQGGLIGLKISLKCPDKASLTNAPIYNIQTARHITRRDRR